MDAGVCGELFGGGSLEPLLRKKFLRSIKDLLPTDLRDFSDFSFCRYHEYRYDAPNSECSLTLSANTILRRVLMRRTSVYLNTAFALLLSPALLLAQGQAPAGAPAAGGPPRGAGQRGPA